VLVPRIDHKSILKAIDAKLVDDLTSLSENDLGYAEKIVFEKIREAKPKKLYIIADGPRKSTPRDYELCRIARSIVENIDWDCNVYKNYSDINLGIQVRS